MHSMLDASAIVTMGCLKKLNLARVKSHHLSSGAWNLRFRCFIPPPSPQSDQMVAIWRKFTLMRLHLAEMS